MSNRTSLPPQSGIFFGAKCIFFKKKGRFCSMVRAKSAAAIRAQQDAASKAGGASQISPTQVRALCLFAAIATQACSRWVSAGSVSCTADD